LNFNKKNCFVTGLFIYLVFFLPWVVNCGDSTPGNPQIFSPEPAHTFETIVEGKTVFHNFIIKNIGDKTLEIQKVKTG